jgi:hypothetical protein
MLADDRIRVQMCGQIALVVAGERREALLPGRQGRMLLAYTVLHRHSPLTSDELCSALWGDEPPRAVESSLGALLSKLRKALGPVPMDGTRIILPPDAWIDLEAAREAIHRAESALVARGNGAEAIRVYEAFAPAVTCGPRRPTLRRKPAAAR